MLGLISPNKLNGKQIIEEKAKRYEDAKKSNQNRRSKGFVSEA
jgi:hypothetical protein